MNWRQLLVVWGGISIAVFLATVISYHDLLYWAISTLGPITIAILVIPLVSLWLSLELSTEVLR